MSVIHFYNVYDILFEPILYKGKLCLITYVPIYTKQIKKPAHVYNIHYLEHYGKFEMITKNCPINHIATLITHEKINLIEDMYLETKEEDFERLFKPKLSLSEYMSLFNHNTIKKGVDQYVI